MTSSATASHRVTVKKTGHTFDVNADETVLEAAIRQGVHLPYGCRNGACGSCKGTLLEGDIELGPHQIAALDERERAAGKALFCVAHAKTDLVIEARELEGVGDIPIRKMPCRLEILRYAAPDVAIMHLKLPANDRLQFLAGQYIELIMKDGKRRAFSMATPPHEEGFIDLHVRIVPGGSFSNYIASGELKEKAILRLEGPYGAFFLREESSKPILFMAGGTGFAPIKAVIEHAFHRGFTRPMTLYWGARTRKDLYLPDLPREWETQHANFKFVPVLSEPSADDGWNGRAGLVHEAMLADIADFSGYQVYGCGAPVMIDVASKAFIARGLPEDQFFADKFTYAVQPAGTTI